MVCNLSIQSQISAWKVRCHVSLAVISYAYNLFSFNRLFRDAPKSFVFMVFDSPSSRRISMREPWNGCQELGVLRMVNNDGSDQFISVGTHETHNKFPLWKDTLPR